MKSIHKTTTRMLTGLLLLAMLISPGQVLATAALQSATNNLLVNGNFEAGNSGFSSDYVYSQLGAAATYTILTNPANAHEAASSFGDHTSGSGLMMALNGADSSDVVVWSQSVTVSPNAIYEFSGWVASWFPAPRANLQMRVNNTPIGTVLAPASTSLWENFNLTWNSGSSTTAKIEIVDLILDAGGNDFALDDLAFNRIDAPCAGLVQEAESGTRTGNWTIGTDAAASGGQYIYAPVGSGNFWNGATSQQRAIYCFNVSAAGTYRIKGKVHAADNLSDSFYLSVDGAPTAGYLWDVLQSSGYITDYVNDRNNADPVELQLSAGAHLVTVYIREPGTQLDTIELERVATLPAPTCAGLVQEAESGTIRGNWAIGSDAAASGGKYIHAPEGSGNFWNGATAAHKASYCFNIETAGTYRIQGKVYGGDTFSDSFYVQVDGSPAGGYLWDILPNTTYASDLVNDRGVADPVEVELFPGHYLVNIFVREDGARLDTLELRYVESVTPPTAVCAGLTQEAEDGALFGNFVIGNDASASGGAYVHTPVGSSDFWNGPNPNHKAEYCFNVPTDGTYRIDGKVYGADTLSDSFYVQVDNAPTAGYLWDVLTNTSYQLDSVSDRNKVDPVTVVLSSGAHTVTVAAREAGTRLDTIQLSSVAPTAQTRAIPLLAKGIHGTVQLNATNLSAEVDFSTISITLFDAETSGQSFRQQVTADRFGNYHFDGMMPGNYIVQLSVPEGLAASTNSATITATADEPVAVIFDVTAANKTYLPLIGR